MLKLEINAHLESEEPVEVSIGASGNVKELAAEMAIAMGAVNNSLKERDEDAARLYRKIIAAAIEDGAAWASNEEEWEKVMEKTAKRCEKTEKKASDKEEKLTKALREAVEEFFK